MYISIPSLNLCIPPPSLCNISSISFECPDIISFSREECARMALTAHLEQCKNIAFQFTLLSFLLFAFAFLP